MHKKLEAIFWRKLNKPLYVLCNNLLAKRPFFANLPIYKRNEIIVKGNFSNRAQAFAVCLRSMHDWLVKRKQAHKENLLRREYNFPFEMCSLLGYMRPEYY